MSKSAKNCPICKLENQKVLSERDYGDKVTYECLRCGRYTISSTAEAIAGNEEKSARLSAWLRERNVLGVDIPMLTSVVLKEVIATLPSYTPIEKQNKLLKAIELLTDHPGKEVVLIPEHDLSLGWAENESELKFYLKSLMDRGLLEIANAGKRSLADPLYPMVITAKGWEHLEKTVSEHATKSDLKQRLVAILAADVAGYSRLMAADEAATVAALEAARTVFRARIDVDRGRVIDMSGDSVLAVFETASGAVSAALAIQQELKVRFADEPEDRRMRFRIGLHLGDVFEKADGTVYGDGINIAARLQALAEPGGITASDAVQSIVRAKVEASFVDMGEQQVKNIPHTVRAFVVHAGSSEVGKSAAQRISGKHKVQKNFPSMPPTPSDPASFVSPMDQFLWSNDVSGLEEIDGYVLPGAKLFLRIIPQESTQALPSTKVAFDLLQRADMLPLRFHETHKLFGRNRLGAFVMSQPEGNKRLNNLTQLFKTKELWGIDSEIVCKERLLNVLRTPYPCIPSIQIEKSLLEALSRYLEFAKTLLKLELPLKLQTGLTGVMNYRMLEPARFYSRGNFPFRGHCHEQNITYEAEVESYAVPANEMLGPFFRKVWEECGLSRPDMSAFL